MQIDKRRGTRAYVDWDQSHQGCWDAVDKTLYSVLGMRLDGKIENCVCGDPTSHFYELVRTESVESK